MSGLYGDNTSRNRIDWNEFSKSRKTRIGQPTRNILRGLEFFVCLTYQGRKVVLGADNAAEQGILYENASKHPECSQARKRYGRLPKYPQGADYVYRYDNDCHVRTGFPLVSFQRFYGADYVPDMRDIVPAVSQLLRWLEQNDKYFGIDISLEGGAKLVSHEGSIRTIVPAKENQHGKQSSDNTD